MRTALPAACALVSLAALTLLAGSSGKASQDAPAITNGASIAAVSMPHSGDQQTWAKKKKRMAPAELFNQILVDPCPSSGTSCPTNFEVVFRGNLTNVIPSQQPLYGHYNAFCPPSRGPSNPCPPYITFNPTANTTTVTFGGPNSTYGTTLYQNSVHPGDVHFALMAGSGGQASIKPLEQYAYWTYASAPPVAAPIVSVNWRQQADTAEIGGATVKWAYAVVYIAGALKPNSPSVYASWLTIPYVLKGSNQPRFAFTNFGKQPIYVTSSGVVLGLPVPTDPECIKLPDCSENMDIISTLNEIGYPPPGTSGSPFVPLQYPPPSVLKPQ
jgi:hypothetical protein